MISLPVNTSMLTAPASSARALRRVHNRKASSLNGTVTLAPRPPLAMKAATLAANPSSGASRAVLNVLSGLPGKGGVNGRRLAVADGVAENAVMIGHGMQRLARLGFELVVAGEAPAAGDDEHVGIASDVGQEKAA